MDSIKEMMRRGEEESLFSAIYYNVRSHQEKDERIRYLCGMNHSRILGICESYAFDHAMILAGMAKLQAGCRNGDLIDKITRLIAAARARAT